MPIEKEIFAPIDAKRKMSVKNALFATQELIEVDRAKDRVLASISVSCPPAVPIVFSGEEINENAIKIMEYYQIEKFFVVKE